MKKSLIFLFTASLFIGCKDNKSTSGNSTNTATTENKTPASTNADNTPETATDTAPKRIDFAKEGSNALVWEEKVGANSSKVFVFYAKKGQKLSLGFIDDTNQGSMDLGKYSVEPNTDPFEMDITEEKDYRLSVSNNSDKATSFRISISLEDAKKGAKKK